MVAGKYIFHKSVTYETMELNEHVIVRVPEGPLTVEDVDCFVRDLKNAVDRLVQPTYDHMSTALTGVLVAEDGIARESARRITTAGFTRHFWLGLRGWCFLRLLGVDLASGQVWANRRGKEVSKAYSPG